VNILNPSLLTFLQNLTNQEAPLPLQESLLQIFLQEDFLLQVFLQEDLLLPQRMSCVPRPYRIIVV
jgi:hypothetical protein